MEHDGVSEPVEHSTIEAGRYTLTAQALHWLTVFLILMILPVAWVMMSLATGPEQDRMLVFHRSLGVTIFAVAVIRLAWRSTHPAPPLPKDTPRVMQLISQLTHWLLYALLLLMPVTGYRLPTVGGWQASVVFWAVRTSSAAEGQGAG
jgi:cytochrome b561